MVTSGGQERRRCSYLAQIAMNLRDGGRLAHWNRAVAYIR